MKTRNYYKTREVAEMLMVSPITVRNWVRSGKLSAERTLGGHRRFLRKDIEHFARENMLKLLDVDHGARRVLIVDDDVEMGNYLIDLMDSAPVELDVCLARNGFEAGEFLQSFAPHILLLDLIMPGLDGFQVCRRIKGDTSMQDTRIVAMTGLQSDENIRKIKNEGADACLIKPFSPDELYAALELQR